MTPSANDSPYRVACLGAGFFSQFHLEAWRRVPGATLVAVADRNVAAARATGVSAYSDLETMLAAETPDIIDIIVPPVGHLPAIRSALRSNAKAIICQKPFCTSLPEAEEAIGLAEAAGIPLIVHENFRFQPWYRTMARAIDAGDIGVVTNVTFRLRPGDGQGPRAYLDRQPYFQDMPRFLVHETAVHWVDTFRFLLGPATSVYADLRRLNPAIAGEDAGIILFDHGAGTRSLFDGNRLLDHAAKDHRRTMGEALVEGTKGTLTLTGDGAVHKRSFGSQEVTCVLEPRDWPGFGGDCVFALQAHVVAALQGEGAFENTARDYLYVLTAEEAIYCSAEEGRRILL